MLREWISYAFTDAPPYARQYRYESVAISARARRQRTAWAPHLAQTKAFFDEQIRRHNFSGETVWVLGSGAVLDIPLATLRARFKQVVLLDLAHPLSVRLRSRCQRGLLPVCADLGGVAQAMAKLDPEQPLPTPAITPPAAPRPDLILSANLWAQLPLFPKAQAKSLGYPTKSIHDFEHAILKAHGDFVQSYNVPTLIVTETERHTTHLPSKKTRITEALPTIALPKHEAQWTWHLAPCGEIDTETDFSCTVSGFKILPMPPKSL